MKTGAAGAAWMALAPGFLMMEGCNVEGLINTAIDAALAVLNVAEPGAAWVADFSQAVTALINAEKSWKSGGAVAIVVDALNTLAAVTAVIPFTAAYSPLIDVLVAGIEAVLTALGATGAAAVKVAARRYVAADGRSYAHQGRATLNKPRVLESRSGAFKRQWNQVAEGAGLAKAKI
jgi:hypothetical protein